MKDRVIIFRYLDLTREGKPCYIRERQSQYEECIALVERLIDLFDTKNADHLVFLEELVDKALELCETAKRQMEV